MIAAGGIADARGIAAAFALGAAGVQIGTAYLRTPEAKISRLHRDALAARTTRTAYSQRIYRAAGTPAKEQGVRELGPMAGDAPAFPLGADWVHAAARQGRSTGSSDFSPLWTGQAGPLQPGNAGPRTHHPPCRRGAREAGESLIGLTARTGASEKLPMRKPASVKSLEDLGRVRLSESSSCAISLFGSRQPLRHPEHPRTIPISP